MGKQVAASIPSFGFSVSSTFLQLAHDLEPKIIRHKAAYKKNHGANPVLK